jgi:hypothetical protein
MDDTFYDTSFIYMGSKIYYFKRIFNKKKISSEPNNDEFVDIKEASKESISRLILFSFDLEIGKEQMVPNLYFIEFKKKGSEFETEFNITFSKAFGKNHKNYDSEEDFLKQQFFLVQKYEKGRKILNKISLYSMRSLNSDWNANLLYMSKDQANFEIPSNRNQNHQATSINHKE